MTCPLRISTKELSIFLADIWSEWNPPPQRDHWFRFLLVLWLPPWLDWVGILAVAHTIKCETWKCILKGFDSSKHWVMETHEVTCKPKLNVKYRWILFEGQKWPDFPDWLGEGKVRILGFLCAHPLKSASKDAKKKNP